MSEDLTPEVVPFAEADIHRIETVHLHSGEGIKLSGERSIEVWRMAEKEGLCVRIFRPTDDGKISKLLFGLTEEAARALAVLLVTHLNTEDEK